MYYVVEFHADGGQMCVPGRRVFESKTERDAFAERERKRYPANHFCKDSVRTYEAEEPLNNEGQIYPMLANSGR